MKLAAEDGDGGGKAMCWCVSVCVRSLGGGVWEKCHENRWSFGSCFFQGIQ